MEVSKADLNFKETVQAVVATPNGEDLLLALETKYNAMPSYVIGDTHQTAYNEGARSVVLELLSCLVPSQ